MKSRRPVPALAPRLHADALIYPGLGFGAMLSKARTLTDTMIIAGTRRLASLAPALADPDDALLPDFADAPRVNYEVAVAVVDVAPWRDRQRHHHRALVRALKLSRIRSGVRPYQLV